MPQTLNTILHNCSVAKNHGDLAIAINALQLDSRKVEKGDMFVAIRGAVADGHQFIAKAIENGASAIVCEEFPAELKAGITYLKVKDSSDALGIFSSNFYNHPSKKLKVVAVTGTNGKTTTATMLYDLFRKMGYKVGLLSTIENIINDEVVNARLTTPDALTINQLMAKMVEEGCVYCFMEASSHAIVQRRLAGLTIAGAIFTNISRDHLDYHQTFKNYINAKKLLFDYLPKTAFALTNIDDKRGRVMLQNCISKHKTYALKDMADFKAKLVENSFEGLCLEIGGKETWFQLIGEFNAYNLLAVYATAISLGENSDKVLAALSELKAAKGRFERVETLNKITALVDYAHTPDALENVLETINAVKKANQRIITVVGCGGDRDKGKRPMMAKVATEKSELTWLTSDNPRSENPEQIIEDMKVGVAPELLSKVKIEVSRREAIKAACLEAQKGDVILVAGKGHETYQEINGERFPFDDKKEIQKLFQSFNNTQYADTL